MATSARMMNLATGEGGDFKPPAIVEANTSEFEQLLREHERQLRQFAFRLLGTQDRMEDALQGAFLRAYRALPSFEPRRQDALRVWLFRIVYRTCIDQLRRDKRREGHELPERGEPVTGLRCLSQWGVPAARVRTRLGCLRRRRSFF